MKGFVSLCDDLTGSSVQAILLKERGLTVRQVIAWNAKIPVPKGGEAVSVNCDTRRRPEQEARGIFEEIASLFPPPIGLGKRIDTTLRGHLCAETAELLAARPGAAALVAPAYPASGRITLGGYHLLGGSLLERTEVARDPLSPVSSSYVPGYFSDAFKTALIPMEIVKKGPESVAETLSRLLKEGTRVIVADSMTDSDVETVAEGAASLDCEFIPVDPGPFTAAYISRKLPKRMRALALAIIGSVSEKTARQIAWTEDKLKKVMFTFDWNESMMITDKKLEEFLGQIPEDCDYILLRPPFRMEHGAEEAIATYLAAMGRQIIRDPRANICGILLSGGDTAAIFFEDAGATRLDPHDEIQPLIMGGRILNGEFAGMAVVTKGGLIGEDDGIYRAVQWLRKERK